MSSLAARLAKLEPVARTSDGRRTSELIAGWLLENGCDPADAVAPLTPQEEAWAQSVFRSAAAEVARPNFLK